MLCDIVLCCVVWCSVVNWVRRDCGIVSRFGRVVLCCDVMRSVVSSCMVVRCVVSRG